MIIKNISLMNILNKSGSSIEPSGTNLATNSLSEMQYRLLISPLKLFLQTIIQFFLP